MATKAIVCDHCKGKKNCTASGGKSCPECLDASGRGRHQFVAVRCSYCGGRGKRWVQVEDEAPAAATTQDAAPEAAVEAVAEVAPEATAED